MHRDIDPRQEDRERPDLGRGGRGASDAHRFSTDADPRDVFGRGLDLPRGPDRERIRARGHEYRLRGSEVRVLATAGVFRAVPFEDLRRAEDRPSVARKDVERLRGLDLVRTMPYVVGRERTTIVILTERGRAVLEASRRNRGEESSQTFYAGIAKPRELAHDVRVYRAYLEASRRLVGDGHAIRRVVLEQELKRAYQTFLQAPNRGRRNSSGRPQRDPLEVANWARDHELPMIDDRVQFPDLRIEYEGRDGRRQIEDVEVMTPHYRGAHAAAKVKAGFTRYYAVGARLGGVQSSTRAGRGRESRLAEEMLG